MKYHTATKGQSRSWVQCASPRVDVVAYLLTLVLTLLRRACVLENKVSYPCKGLCSRIKIPVRSPILLNQLFESKVLHLRAKIRFY
jgi:hypothetical protein